MDRQRPGNRHPLLHPAGKLANPGVGKLGKLGARQHIRDAFAPLRRRQRMMLQHQRDIVRHRAPRQQGEILKNKRQRIERCRRRRALQPHRAMLGALQPANHPQQRRFTAAGRADDADNLARLNRKRHLLQHLPPVIAVGNALNQKPHQSASSALASSVSGTSFCALNQPICLRTSSRFSRASGEINIAPSRMRRLASSALRSTYTYL